jgi:valyl-tRNA synthetase
VHQPPIVVGGSAFRPGTTTGRGSVRCGKPPRPHPAKEKDPDIAADALRQDEDVLDTWFRAGRPMSVSDGFWEDKTELAYYYPTNTWSPLDIMLSPVLIMAGNVPVRDLLLVKLVRNRQPAAPSATCTTGMVRDEKRRRCRCCAREQPGSPELLKKVRSRWCSLRNASSAGAAGNDIVSMPH